MTFNRVKSSLPLYKTGWFYMIVALWCVIYWSINYYGLSLINEFQQTLLNQLFILFGSETYFSVNDPKRLSQTYFLIFLPFLLNLLGLGLIGWISRLGRLSRVKQSGFLAGYCLLLLIANYYFYSQSLWLDVLPSIFGLILTWLLMLLYQNENNLLESTLNQRDQLLVDAIAAFYQNQQFDKIMAYLSQVEPNQFLVNQVYDLSKQSEHKNKALTKNLLDWIEKSSISHPQSAKKIDFINAVKQKNLAKLAKPQKFKAESLDKTMVIQPGDKDKNKPELSQQIFPVKNFGRYAVEGLLGKGAMGTVYQGVDPKINRHVAIKTLVLNREADDAEFDNRKKQFFREAQTAGNLNHPNIVTIYDVGEEGDLGYIAMDLLTGAPLSEFTKPDNRLPAALTYHLVAQIAEALEYAHQNKVVHRDIKPSNIIYDDELQKVTVTDFGIAFSIDNNKTHSGTIMGSPYYMSPEQIMGEAVDGRSDIFSLGVTFYQLLTGYLPFEGNSLASVSHQIINAKPISVGDWDPQLPPSANRITSKAMHKEIDKRYQSMTEFKFALVNALKRDFKITSR